MEILQREIAVSDFFQACVDIPRFAECCRLCPNYGKLWSCAPYDFSPADIWHKHSTLLLQCRVIPVPEALQRQTLCQQDINEQSRALLQPHKRAMLQEMLALERQFPGSLALDAGSCDRCASCTRLEGHPCRHPEALRYSVEALGGDVCKALKLYFDKEILWGMDGHMPAYYLLLGGLLKA